MWSMNVDCWSRNTFATVGCFPLTHPWTLSSINASPIKLFGQQSYSATMVFTSISLASLTGNILSYKLSIDHLSCCTDEEVLKVLVYFVLCEKDNDMAPEYLCHYQNWFKARSCARPKSQSSDDR